MRTTDLLNFYTLVWQMKLISKFKYIHPRKDL